jgi:sec-independent protein translocase protein TatC
MAQVPNEAHADPESPAKPGGPVMGVFDHIDELRARLMRCIYIFMAGFAACYFFAEPMLEFLRRPLFAALPPEQHKLYFTSLFENFLTHIKVAGYGSLLFLSPLYFLELWKFISPGLREGERRWVFPFVSFGALFFVAGASFAYYVLFPVGFKYFVQYGGPADVPLLTISNYYDTCLKLMLLFGLAFELPVLIVFMGWLGLVSAEGLRTSRRTAILGITLASALFAPPDAMSMLLLMAPLIILYEAAIIVVAWLQRGRKLAGQGLETPEKHPWA